MVRYKIKRTTKGKGWACHGFDGSKEFFVKKSLWPEGLNTSLSVEEARKVVDVYNKDHKLKTLQRSAFHAGKRRELLQTISSAYLPPHIVDAFIQQETIDRSHKHKLNWNSLFRVVQHVITTLNLNPIDWHGQQRRVYKYFEERHLSLDYCNRAISLLNRYGRYWCNNMTTNKRYEDVEWAKGRYQAAILDSFYEQKPDGKKSDALTLDTLAKMKEVWDPAYYNWLAMSFWFGLRPEEVDLLTKPQEDRVRRDWWVEKQGGTWVLVIDQPKIKQVRLKDRYKRIPALYGEQEEALRVALGGTLKRPGRRAVKRLPKGVRLYGGRHGFTSYMEQKGHPIEHISKWLGHQNMATTENYYRDRGLTVGVKAA